MANSGSSFRLITVLPVAAVVTAGLFLVMSALISTEAELGVENEPPDIKIWRTEIVEPNELENIGPPKDPPPTPDPPINTWERDDTGPVINLVDPTPPDPKGNPKIKLPTLADALLTPTPQYPASCQGRNIEGYAVVEFDVTGSGNVVNARIFDSSDRCFNSASIRAIQKWKFQPSGNGGNSITRSGLRKRFVFRLTD